ncbi:MAG: hypothetical protein AAF198_02700 [Pseudomonadota bacterium]
MRRLWSWLSDETNRTVLGFVIGLFSGLIPAALAAYVYYNGDLFPDPPESADICRPLKEEIPAFADTMMQRHSNRIVLVAKEDTTYLNLEIIEKRDALYDEFAEVRRFTLDGHFLYHLCETIYRSDLAPNTMNITYNVSMETLVQEGRENLLANADFLFADDPQGIAGNWFGQYSYAVASEFREFKPVEFHIRFVREDMKLHGGVFEPNTFSPNKETVQELFSTLQGGVEESSSLFFRKTYADIDGVDHSIDYQGIYDPIGKTIRGTWRSTDNPDWWGRFLMEKS